MNLGNVAFVSESRSSGGVMDGERRDLQVWVTLGASRA